MALLKTKFLHPVTSDKTVLRSRLFGTLALRPGKRATFVVAPAGFGKTTLISHWATHWEGGSCWLSLDSTDNNPQNFWHYVIGALQQNWPSIGLEALRLSSGDENADVLPAITSLLNDLAGQPLKNNAPTCLVLDDFHLIEDPSIHRSFAYFIDYLPPSLCVLLATRIEPDLPLARWRVKGYLDELYTTDLAFSPEETQLFFRNYASLDLSLQTIDSIQQATSGWIAAIQLMVLSQKQPSASKQAIDVEKLVSGGKRLIDDYVLSEILIKQPLEVREFLQDSACLMRMNHELCDAIRNTHDSRDMLAVLERANLFIVPLDNRQYWYRYHDLFREALLHRAGSLQPERTKELQQKAVRWYLQHEYFHEALSQLIALQDWPWMVQVLEEQGNQLIRSGYHLYLIEWLNMVPSTLLDESPRLLMLRIWCLFYDNKIEALQPVLRQLTQLIGSPGDRYSLAPQELQQLQSEISLIQSYLARSSNKTEDATNLTHQVLERIRETDIPLKSVGYYGVGLDYFAAGELGMAVEALESAIHHGKIEKRYSTVLSSLGLLMWIHFSRGDLTKALSINQATQVWLDNFHKHQPQPELVSCWRNTSLCEIYREQNNLTAAQAYLNPLLHYFDSTEPGQRIMIHYAQAGLAFSQRKYPEALNHLDMALAIHEQKSEQIMFEPPSLRATKLRCCLAQNHLDQAEIHARHIEHSGSSNPLNRQRENLCRARLEIARHSYMEAEAVLASELEFARDKLYLKHEIQCLILLAIVYQALGRDLESLQSLGKALEMAERTNSIRLFTDESPELFRLIDKAGDANISSQFRQAVLASFGEVTRATPAAPQKESSSAQMGFVELQEPVSKRELEVLQLINEGLANKQIAVKLNLAPATVKAHIRNLYGKIGASSRTEALAKARRLGLMD